MPDDQEPVTNGPQRRPRQRRPTAATAATAGAVASPPDPPAATKPETPMPAGLRVARAVPQTPVSGDGARPRGRARPTPSTEHSALPTEVGPAGIDGVPGTYDDGSAWLRNGLKRHPWGVLVALLFGWTGAWLALWGAAIGIVVGICVAVGVVDTSSLGSEVTRLGGGQSITILSLLAGAFFGAIGGFLEVLRYLLAETPWEAIVAIASGAVVAAILTIVTASFERASLRLRGYRRLSRDEVRRVAPLVRDVADGLDLDGLPRFAMADVAIPNAWTHMRTVVITTGLLQMLDDAELRAVLAHELHHWRSGDSVGLHIVWAAALPLAVTINVGMLIAGRRGQGNMAPGHLRGVMVLIGWAIAWPALVVVWLVLMPTIATTQRRYEYAADAAAGSLGYSAALIAALRKMGAFESGRTGWEYAIGATHPPIELRIEALQPPKPDDAQYQEDDLSGGGWRQLRRLARDLVHVRSRH